MHQQNPQHGGFDWTETGAGAAQSVEPDQPRLEIPGHPQQLVVANLSRDPVGYRGIGGYGQMQAVRILRRAGGQSRMRQEPYDFRCCAVRCVRPVRKHQPCHIRRCGTRIDQRARGAALGAAGWRQTIKAQPSGAFAFDPAVLAQAMKGDAYSLGFQSHPVGQPVDQLTAEPGGVVACQLPEDGDQQRPDTRRLIAQKAINQIVHRRCLLHLAGVLSPGAVLGGVRLHERSGPADQVPGRDGPATARAIPGRTGRAVPNPSVAPCDRR